ncbi:MAG: LysM peptidoglycan-binding domain-containing protein [Deltaproteobacteria bacterium]|nr:LysM peptidoglycan-binding domain-containing protein [Deltaproteobacteria bacterium]
MEKDADSGKKDFVMEFIDGPDSELDAESESALRRRPSRYPSGMWGAVAVAAGIALLGGLFLGYFFGGDGDSPMSEDLKSISAGVESLENRIERLESLDDRLAQLERQGTGLRQSQARSQDKVKSLSKQLNIVSERVRKLESRTAAAPKRSATKSTTVSKTQSTKTPKYHEITAGDTLYRISIKYGITVDELCRLNNISRKQVLNQGKKLIVSE